MKFPIVTENKKNIRLKYIIVFSIIFVIIVGSIFYPENENNINTLFITIPCIIWLIALVFSNFAIKNSKIIGEIELKNYEIIINNEKISLSTIKAVKIVYDNYYGVWIRLNVTQGDNNEIFILTNENKQIRLRIFLKDKLSYGNLKLFASKLIQNDVKVIFYDGNKRIYPKP